MQFKNRVTNYVVLVAMSIGIFTGGFWLGKYQQASRIVPAPNGIDFSLFYDAFNQLHKNYVNPEKIDNQKLLYGAIDGMTAAVGDRFTTFFDPEQAKMFESDLSGSFSGIGVEVGIAKGQLTIIAPLKGTPGDKAGLRPGDIIVKINGKSTTDMSSDEAVSLIRGNKGTSVTLTIFRAGWKDTKDFTLVRDTIKVDSVSWSLKNNDVAVIKISIFDQHLAPDFSGVAREILASPAKKIVLDLRQNPGGYLEVCQQIAGWFLESGQTVVAEDFGKGKEQELYRAEGNSALLKYPMVILQDGGSASASEILAGALRDNRKVQLVGEQSFGKGSVQQLFNLSDGNSFLKITVARWLTPNGYSISEVGLKPDVKVDITDDDILAHKDPQLDKALEIVKNLQ